MVGELTMEWKTICSISVHPILFKTGLNKTKTKNPYLSNIRFERTLSLIRINNITYEKTPMSLSIIWKNGSKKRYFNKYGLILLKEEHI